MGATSDVDFLTFRRKTISLDPPLHATPQSLHNPNMWEDLRQAIYEATRYEERRKRHAQMARLRRHQRRNRNRSPKQVDLVGVVETRTA